MPMGRARSTDRTTPESNYSDDSFSLSRLPRRTPGRMCFVLYLEQEYVLLTKRKYPDLLCLLIKIMCSVDELLLFCPAKTISHFFNGRL